MRRSTLTPSASVNSISIALRPIRPGTWPGSNSTSRSRSLSGRAVPFVREPNADRRWMPWRWQIGASFLNRNWIKVGINQLSPIHIRQHKELQHISWLILPNTQNLTKQTGKIESILIHSNSHSQISRCAPRRIKWKNLGTRMHCRK